MATVDLTQTTQYSQYSETRMSVFKARYDMYNDNYRSLVERRLEEIYAKAKLLRMDKQIDMTNNVYKAIVDKISKVYSQGVLREFSDEKMSQLYIDSRIDKYMQAANRYVNAYNDVLVQVSWDEVSGKPHLIFRYPHKTRVSLDEYGNPYEVEYFVGINDEDNEIWAYWSESEHYYKVYESEDKYVEVAVDGNDKKVNPYGVLPFVFMQNGFRDDEFFDVYSGSDMVESTLDVAVYNTFKNYMIKWQSFKQIVVQGSNVGVIKGQVLDPSTALTAEGDDIKIDVLDLQANIKELSEVINLGMTNVAINYNISPSQFRMSGSPSSGFSLMMENKALDDMIRQQQDDFIDYEKELYRLLVTIGNTHNAALSEGEFMVMFPEITYQEASKDVAETREKNISLGLTNAVEILMEDKEIDEEEATKVFNENITIRNQANENLNTPEIDATSTASAMGIEV